MWFFKAASIVARGLARVRLRRRDAPQIDTVWECVSLVQQTVNTLPLHSYELD